MSNVRVKLSFDNTFVVEVDADNLSVAVHTARRELAYAIGLRYPQKFNALLKAYIDGKVLDDVEEKIEQVEKSLESV